MLRSFIVLLFSLYFAISIPPTRYVPVSPLGTEIRTVEANNKVYLTYTTDTQSKFVIFTDLTNFNEKSEGEIEITASRGPYHPNAKVAAHKTKTEMIIAQSNAFMKFDLRNDQFDTRHDYPFTGIASTQAWDVIPLSDGNLIVVSINSQLATIRKYNSAYVDLTPSPPITIDIFSNTASCIEFESSKHLLCLYPHKTLNQNYYYKIYDHQAFTLLKAETYIEEKPNFGSHGERLIHLSIDIALICTLKLERNEGYVYCFVGEYQSSTPQLKKISPTGSSIYAVLYPCIVDIKYVSVAKFTEGKFVCICLSKYDNQKFIFSVVKYTPNSGMVFDTTFDTGVTGVTDIVMGYQVSFPNLIVFSSEVIGIFNTKITSSSSIEFQLLNGPNCQDYIVPTPVEVSATASFIFPPETFVNGMYQTSDRIHVKFHLNPTENLKILKGSSPITAATNQFSSTDTISYNAGTRVGSIIFLYTAVKVSGAGVNTCKITFKVELTCYSLCLTCSALGTFDDMKCDTCDENQSVYPYKKIPGMCYDDATHLTQIPGTAYNPDSKAYEDCFSTCKTCSEIGTRIDMNCLSCNLITYYPLENDPTKCYGDSFILAGTYLDSIDKKYKFCSEGCLTCKFDAGGEVCQICKDLYYPLSTDLSQCVNETTKPGDFFLNKDNDRYEPCYNTCATCSKGGLINEHNCDTCIASLIKQPLKETNCVTECAANLYWYVDAAFEYHCTSTQSCPPNYPYLVEGTTQCAISCSKADCYACNSDAYFKYEIWKQCVKKCPSGTQANMILNECENSDVCRKASSTTTQTAEEFTRTMDQVVLNYSKIYDSTDKQVDEILNDHYKVIIYKNETCASAKLDLHECIEKLRNKYPIPVSIPFITLKMDLYRVNQTNQVNYAFYSPIDGTRLDMTICQEEKTIVTVPIGDTEGVDLDEAKEFEKIGVDVYNESDPFFNDICFEYSTEDGKDVTLEDRKKSYYQNVSVCEEGCTYKGVNLTLEEVSCECEVKTSFITELLDNPLTGEILSFLNQANFEIIKCYEDVFNINKFVKNVGSWIILGLGLLEVAFTIYYSQVGVYPVNAFLLQYIKVNPPRKSKETNEKDDDMDIDIDNNHNEKRVSNGNSSPEIFEEGHGKIEVISNSPSVLIHHRNSSNQKLKLMNLNHQNYVEVPESGTLSSGKGLLNPNFKSPEEKITIPEVEEEYEDFELNDLELEDAIMHDKRGFCKTYWQLLQENHTVINTFFTSSPLESFPIKAICFFFSISLFFAVNALFYDESYISKQFNSTEPFNLFYLLKNEMNRCIYSTIVAIAVNIILSFLFSSKKKIRSLVKRHKDNQEKLRSDGLKIVKGMKITNIVFIVVNFILMFCFWYFVSAFCAIFSNSTGSWLIGCAITWVLTFLIPFALSFLSAVLRFIGIKCNCDMFYRLGQILS